MREVLFRGKGINTGEWRYGNFVVENWTSKIVTNTGEKFSVVTATVGQYTEVDDVDGNKIFEGDIVKVELVDGEYFTTGYVRKDEASYVVFGKEKWKVMSASDSYEILGNTTDNPELLK